MDPLALIQEFFFKLRWIFLYRSLLFKALARCSRIGGQRELSLASIEPFIMSIIQGPKFLFYPLPISEMFQVFFLLIIKAI